MKIGFKIRAVPSKALAPWLALGTLIAASSANAQGFEQDDQAATAAAAAAPTFLLPVIESFADRRYTIDLVRLSGSTSSIVGSVYPDLLIRGYGPWFSVADRSVSGTTETETLPKRLVFTSGRKLMVMDLTDRGSMPVAKSLANGRPICQMNRVVYVSGLASQAWLEVNPYVKDIIGESCATSSVLYVPLNSASTAAPITLPTGLKLEESIVDGSGKHLGFLVNNGTALKWLSPDRTTVTSVGGASTLIGLKFLASLPDGTSRLYKAASNAIVRLNIGASGVTLTDLNSRMGTDEDVAVTHDADSFYWQAAGSLKQVGRTGAMKTLGPYMYGSDEMVLTNLGPVRLAEHQIEFTHKVTGIASTADLWPNEHHCVQGASNLAWTGKHVYFVCTAWDRSSRTLKRATVNSTGIVVDDLFEVNLGAGWQYQYGGKFRNGTPLVESVISMQESLDTKGYQFADVGKFTSYGLETGVATPLGNAYESFSDIGAMVVSAHRTRFKNVLYGWSVPILRAPFRPNTGADEERIFSYTPGAAGALKLMRRTPSESTL